jgi:integrase
MSGIYQQTNETHPLPLGNKGKLIGQKPPLKAKEVWSIRVRLQILGKTRDLALLNMAIDSKLRSCDLMALRISDVVVAGNVRERAVIVQQKTGRPVQFKLTEQTREAVHAWIAQGAARDGGATYSQAASITVCTYRPVNMPGLLTSGWLASDLIHIYMAHTRYGEL